MSKVVFGVPKYPLRPTWKIWEEGKAPDVIFELSSRSTAGEDLYRKYRLYQRLGVKEYILIDVTREYLAQPLLLHRLTGREYILIPNERHSDREWWADSEQLGLRIVVRAEDRGYLIRLWDPVAQRFLPSPHEAAEGFLSLWERLQEAQHRAEEEARARAELERRLREMEAELKRLKGEDSSPKA